jgi:hypothetical protein
MRMRSISFKPAAKSDSFLKQVLLFLYFFAPHSTFITHQLDHTVSPSLPQAFPFIQTFKKVGIHCNISRRER